MNLILIPEYELTNELSSQINDLFSIAFEGYPTGQIYYNQSPQFRILAITDNKLLGHVGVHHRHIKVGTSIFSVFGLIDLCVSPVVQHRHVGSNLLDHVQQIGQRGIVDFLVLTSEVSPFYKKNGFLVVHNPCRWLVIHNHQSLGVLKRELTQGLMIKPLSEEKWPSGEVDFMGHMF